MDLSIVIVNWNSGPYLGRLLDTLEILIDEVAQIIVVDNASSDNSQNEAARKSCVDLYQLEHNEGFARAANLGIGKAESRYVLLLNPDLLVLAETVRELYQEIECGPKYGIVCSALVGEDGVTQESFQIRPLPTTCSVIRDALFVDELIRFFKPAPLLISAEKPREVEQPAAAFWLIRYEAWKQIGGFDESFFPAWFEDVDFCKRLIEKGWKIMFYPQWHVIHCGGITLHQMKYGEFVDIYYSNLLRYWKKHHPSSLPLVWLPVQIGMRVRKLLIRR